MLNLEKNKSRLNANAKFMQLWYGCNPSSNIDYYRRQSCKCRTPLILQSASSALAMILIQSCTCIHVHVHDCTCTYMYRSFLSTSGACFSDVTSFQSILPSCWAPTRFGFRCVPLEAQQQCQCFGGQKRAACKQARLEIKSIFSICTWITACT